ncbi:MAG: hypothetical protein H0X40_17195 [Chthoniobacterales bacterium]|nr:hypothetical protein [Chthoniobacterales bacterium]
MSALTPEQMEGLFRAIQLTREHEFDCSECQNHLGEFTEKQLAGLPTDEVLARVAHHLSLCPQCSEEFVALEKILRAND